MTKRFTTWGNRIKRNGKLLNIEFKTKTDAKLCCKLCNQMDKDNQKYIDELDEIFKWYKEYYGETILDTKMGWNDNNKISELKKENEQLKYKVNDLLYQIGYVGKNNKSCDGCNCFLEDIGYCWMWDMNVKKEDIVVACDKREVKSEKKRIGEKGDVK